MSLLMLKKCLTTLIYKLITMRQDAMKWWNKTPSFLKDSLSRDYYKRSYETLTGREIERLFKNVVLRAPFITRLP